MSQLSCSSFSAGVVEAVLDGLGFVSSLVILHFWCTDDMKPSLRESQPITRQRICIRTVPRSSSNSSNPCWSARRPSKHNAGPHICRNAFSQFVDTPCITLPPSVTNKAQAEDIEVCVTERFRVMDAHRQRPAPSDRGQCPLSFGSSTCTSSTSTLSSRECSRGPFIAQRMPQRCRTSALCLRLKPAARCALSFLHHSAAS